MAGKYNTGDDDNLVQQLADLRRRVADLESGNRIGATSIDKGSLRVTSGQFTVGTVPQLYFGPVVQGTATSTGWIFRRADATIVFALQGGSDDDQYWAFYDNFENVIISDDAYRNQGLARPYIPIVFAENSTFAFNVNTTSPTFVGLWNARYTKQHPRVRVECLTRPSDVTTAGELRLFNLTTGVQIGEIVTVPAGVFTTYILGPDDVNPRAGIAGAHMSTQEIEVQARVTAGAGNIGVKIYAAYGEQS